MSLSQATMGKIHTKSGITIAVLSILQDGMPWTVNGLVERLNKAGRKTSPQEVAGVMIALQKSDIKNVLEIDTGEKAYKYRLKEPFTKATLEELRDCYLKRVKNFTHKNLLSKYAGEESLESNIPPEAQTPPGGIVENNSAGVVEEEQKPRVILVDVSAGEVVTVIIRGNKERK